MEGANSSTHLAWMLEHSRRTGLIPFRLQCQSPNINEDAKKSTINESSGWFSCSGIVTLVTARRSRGSLYQLAALTTTIYTEYIYFHPTDRYQTMQLQRLMMPV